MTARFDHIGSLTAKVPATLVGLAIGRVAFISVDSNYRSAHVTVQIDQAQDKLPQTIVQRC